MWQFYGLAAGGSRERFDVGQFYRLRPPYSIPSNEHAGQKRTLGNSREPPAFTFLGRTRDSTKYR